MDPYNLLVYILAYIGLLLVSFYFIGMLKYYKKKEHPPRTDLTVSIIIPAYNEEKSIERTIRTALALEYPAENLEVIVVDDGSKDMTYPIARSILEELENSKKKHPTMRVFTKPNGGKGSALNLGINQSKSEIVLTMDADTFAKPDSLKKMMGYFYGKEVMSVTPAIGIYKPQGLWQRVQHIEYYMSVFLRKSFSVLNAVHITPGAFAAYRRAFFTKHGGFDEHNITEDIEVALRVQSNHYVIENTPYAVIYTLAPRTFRQFLNQRKRWYTGYLTNLWQYKHLFTPRYGPLGIMVLPAAMTTLVLAIVLTIYSVMKAISHVHDSLTLLQSTGFQFTGFFDINKYILEQFIYQVFSQPIFLFAMLFIFLLSIYVSYSRRTMHYKEGIKLNFVLFILTYSFVYALFWIISLLYLLFGKKVKWK